MDDTLRHASRGLLAAAAAAMALAAGCFGGGPQSSPAPGATGDDAGTDAGASPTFHKDVEPILQQHCDMCHVQGGVAPMPLVTYQDTQPYASLVASYTSSGKMPPWGAVSTPDCAPPLPWKDDPTLSAEQIATLGAWASAGAPEGNPADAPPAFDPK